MVSGYISTFCSGAVSETSLLFPASEHFLQEAGVDPDSRKGVKEYIPDCTRGAAWPAALQGISGTSYRELFQPCVRAGLIEAGALENKLLDFRNYYNSHRAHSSLEGANQETRLAIE